MKLRIRGNSLRFRLGRSEVQDFGLNGKIEEAVDFGSGVQSNFSYSIEKTMGEGFWGTFTDGRIKVGVPKILVDHWINSDEVSMEGKQKLTEDTDLKFLIEKDFVCLNAHNDEDQSDRYPHPKGDATC